MKKLPILVFILVTLQGFAQQGYNPLLSPNSYRNTDNPNYWRNKMPFPGYWQQDVHYTIKASVDERTDIITASEKLEYWNNSPDVLPYVFFHLYQNAFQPESYHDHLLEENAVTPEYGKYERDGKGTEIKTIRVDGKDLKTELDNTILKVWLPTPLKPGESVVFDIDFLTYFDGRGDVRRRMKTFNSFGYKHYDGVHWYPRISVYDRKFGWTTDQHLGREFYGDFGTFDVELTFAENFVMDATGNLVNRNEVLPADLRQKLDIKNFSTKPWNSKPSEIIPYNPDKRKTWKFHAENVHDFAFTADPTYRIGESTWNGISCIALAQEPHAALWQNASDYTAKIIQTFSEDFGMYTYHKMIVADARDGMEYPMLTLDGGYEPEYRGLFIHEIGHNWFFGQVGNNETYRAALDEGFTQFLTAWGLQKIDGDTMIDEPIPSAYLRKFTKPNLAVERSAYRAYLSDALKQKDPALNTHSDGFGGALRHGGGYRHVYYKTATMLYNLQYVLGDELFLKAMQHYFNQWKIAHPYMEDFRNSIIQYTGRDLNWFFDQWFETTKRIDYGIKHVKKGNAAGEYKITFTRKERMQMPLDFTVIDKKGKPHDFLIPNDWFAKETQATVLPRWIGWDKLQPEYTATVAIQDGLADVIIDPSGRLADVRKLDNKTRDRVSLSIDHQVYNSPDQTRYELFWRPDFWFNKYDGLKAGLHLNGDYMNYLHKFDVTVWYNTGAGQQPLYPDAHKTNHELISYRFNYTTATDQFIPQSSIHLKSRWLDGLQAHSAGFEKWNEAEDTKIYTYFKSLYRPSFYSMNYLMAQQQWNPMMYNNSLNLGIDHAYQYAGGKGDITMLLKSSSLLSDYNYHALTLNAVNSSKLGKLILQTRVFAQYGAGGAWAPESQLYLAGANPEEQMESKYYRSNAFFDQNQQGYGAEINSLHAGGGLNLRGYTGYLAPEVMTDGSTRLTYKGTTGAALNVEIEFNQLIGINPRFLRNAIALRTYAFGDAGVINMNANYEDLEFGGLRADAGIGAALTIQRWGPLQMVKPLTLRFDVPLFLNSIPAVESNYVAYRWVVGIGRTF